MKNIFKKAILRLFPFFESLGIHLLPVGYNSPLPGTRSLLRNRLLRWFSILPPEIRLGNEFRKTLAILRENRNSESDHVVVRQQNVLRKLLRSVVEHVPYYKGYDPDEFPGSWPIVTKEMISNDPSSFISRKMCMNRGKATTTGGTTGKPFSFFIEKGISENRERAFFADMWSRVGYRLDSRVARLRGDLFDEEEIRKGITSKYVWARLQPQPVLVLSSFHMDASNLEKYYRLIIEEKIEFLHAYFSSAVSFAQYLIEQKKKLSPPLVAVLCGSENLYEGQREIIEKGFGCRMFSWYGHSEKCILAGECEYNNYYHICPEYGFFELLDENGNPIHETGKRGRIVGTGFNNSFMPFIRYETDDFAEYQALKGCPDCGRKNALLRKVDGRWLQEHILTGGGHRVSMTAMNIHDDLFSNVSQFQYYQEKVGEIEIRVVSKNLYSSVDEARLKEYHKRLLGADTKVSIRRVDSVELTSSGKFKFVIQKLKNGA